MARLEGLIIYDSRTERKKSISVTIFFIGKVKSLIE